MLFSREMLLPVIATHNNFTQEVQLLFYGFISLNKTGQKFCYFNLELTNDKF